MFAATIGHVAYGVDVRCAGAQIGVDHHGAVVVERDASLVEAKILRRRPPPCRKEDQIGAQLLALTERQHTAVSIGLELERPAARMLGDALLSQRLG